MPKFTLIQEHAARGETHNDVLQVEADGSNPETNKRMPQKPEMIFWRISGNLIYRHGYSQHHSSLLTLSGRTNTTSDVLPASRMDDYGSVDGGRERSGPWTGFAPFSRLSQRPPNGHTWSRERLNKSSGNSQAPLFGARTLVKYVEKLSTKKEKALGAIERPKLDNAGKLKGIYHIELDDLEFTDTLKNARKMLEVPLESAMPCELRSVSWLIGDLLHQQSEHSEDKTRMCRRSPRLREKAH